MRTSTLQPDNEQRIDTEMTELSLLVPSDKLAQLERLAQSQGLTLGQMIRRLINAFLQEP